MDDSDSLLNGRDDSFLASLLQADTKEAHLDAVTQSMLASLAAPLAPEPLEDPKFLDSLSLASRLFVQCLEGTETSLGDSSRLSSLKDLETRINLWQNSLEPWHECLKKLKNLGTVPYKCLEKLLDSLPRIIRAVFGHCKRSSDLYGRKFDELRSQLTRLYRTSGLVLADFFSLIDSRVNFNGQVESESNVLKAVLEKIGDIAVVADGVDLKTLMNTWKVFAKLAVVHESLVKKSSSTDVVTSRYTHIAKDIRNLLLVSLQERGQDTNYDERAIKFAGFLLKILGRLCALYRGYCGNKVSYGLVQLLANVNRYTPPFPSHIFVVSDHSVVSRYSETHIVPAATDLLGILIGEPEFSKAFFLYGQSELEDPICYHLLSLSILEELIEAKVGDFSLWIQKDENIVDLTLSNVNRCCADLLVDQVRVPARNSSIFGSAEELGVYEISLKLLCHFVSGISCDDYALVETSLLKHLVGEEFWSSLLSCDLWTYLATVSSLEWCSEYVSYFLEVRKVLRLRNSCHEFGMMSHLLGRLWKILPEDTRESIFKDIEELDDRRLLDPARKSPRQLATGNNELEEIFQDFCRSPSATNWSRLISTLRSSGTLPNVREISVFRDIWNFVAARIPRSDGNARQMLLELFSILLDCSAPDSTESSQNDLQAASIYRSMHEIVDHLPPEYRLKINIFLRENLVSRINDNGKESIAAISLLFCRLIDDDNLWVRQEYFETYNEYIVQMASPNLFDALSIGINRSPRVCSQMQLYLSNKKIHNFSRYSSIEDYLRDLAVSRSNDPARRHKCYQPDSSQPEEKRARLECKTLDERIDHICNEIQFIIEKKNELSDFSIDKLRLSLLQFFQNGL